MPNLRVISENPAVTAAELVAALVATTDLEEAAANALVHVILETVPNAYVGGKASHHDLFTKIAGAVNESWQVGPNHAFNRNRRVRCLFGRASVAAGRLTWSRYAASF